MKKLLLVIAVLFTNLVAEDIDLWKKSTLNQILQRGELRVGTEPGYMPFEMKDKKGNIIGYDIDLAKRMAKEMKVKLKVIPSSFDGLIGGLLTGKFDMIMAGMTITPQRNLKVNFTNPYVTIGQTLLIRKDLKDTIQNAKDLDDSKYTVTTQLGVTGEVVARKYFKNAKLKTYDTQADAVTEVLSGRADAFIYDQPYNILFMSDKGKGRLIHLDTPLSYEPLGIAIRKGDPDFLNWLNNFMVQIKEDKLEDFHHNLYEKWLAGTDWLKRVQ